MVNRRRIVAGVMSLAARALFGHDKRGGVAAAVAVERGDGYAQPCACLCGCVGFRHLGGTPLGDLFCCPML